MKRKNLKERMQSLYQYLRRTEPELSELTVKVESEWAEGKTPSVVETCLGGSVHIDQVIRPASCEVLPRKLDSALRHNDVLLMHADASAQSRIEAFVGRNL